MPDYDPADELPPPEFLDKLPNQGDNGDLFLAGGWGQTTQPVDLLWDQASARAKPEMVREDDEKAYREGFRER